ncbi:hypothetical protein HA402_000727 [Bradysia odoriphaga]|nr:hypothetical protein HA402_000727 [Bradysia odoriphaga]
MQFPPLPEGECGEEELKPDGLTAVFNEFSETFPTFEFLGTFLEALTDDEEVVQVLSLLLTDDFNNLLNKIGDIDEWVEITDIFCDDLQFNVNFYLKVIGDLFKVIPIDPSTPKSENRPRPGVMGLLHDIVDILPLNEWQPKFNELIEENEVVRIAIDTVKGDLFKAVVVQTCQMDEFRALSNKLHSLGLPIACGMTELETILGWPNATCECGDIRVLNKC